MLRCTPKSLILVALMGRRTRVQLAVVLVDLVFTVVVITATSRGRYLVDILERFVKTANSFIVPIVRD